MRNLKYGLDDRPEIVPFLLYGLQWWVVSLPCIVIMGLLVARLHFTEVGLQIAYMQKLFVLMGAATIVQTFLGHRLPLVVGPASTLLVGIIATQSAGLDAMYTAIFFGGFLLLAAGASGFFSRLRFFFTPRIVAVILILIAFTLSPTILRLVLDKAHNPTLCFCFALAMVLALLLCNTFLPGVWKSLTVLLGMAGGSLAFFTLFGFPGLAVPAPDATASTLFISSLDFHPGALLSFLFCFLALTINELGSIESIGQMLNADNMEQRIRKGVSLQGLANMAAGGLGVIGPVDFSLSAGVIAATGCASRYTLVPAGAALAACGLFPGMVSLLSCIPGVVMGAVMLYLMASQLSSGLALLVSGKGVDDFNSGITVGLPLMIGLLIAFAPQSAFQAFPDLLRPIVGNGFVVGTITVILLEHVILKKPAA